MYELVFECGDYLVVNKQTGSSIHNESGDGLIQRLGRDYHNQAIAPVHRLDKATSGLLLCAKHTQANQLLSQLFQQRQIEKYYLAISDHKPNKKQGLIVGDMLRARNGSWKLSKTTNNPAITQFFSYGIGDGRRLFVLKPHTGKTHQLRVALKSLGAAIIGDQRYGSASESEQVLCLHAFVLRFPYQGETMSYQCYPSKAGFDTTAQDFIRQKLSEPWQLNWPTLPKQLLPKLQLNVTNQRQSTP